MWTLIRLYFKDMVSVVQNHILNVELKTHYLYRNKQIKCSKEKKKKKDPQYL